jgi:hypothetical protein
MGGAYIGTNGVQHLSHYMIKLHDLTNHFRVKNFTDKFLTCPAKTVTYNSDHAMTQVITHQYLTNTECQYYCRNVDE